MAHSMERPMERTGSRKLIERRLASSNYRLLKILGEGTYGTVYLARDWVNKQLVAIKVIEKRRISPDDMVRVRREIQVLSVLRQPNIIQIYRVHEDDSSLYLVMEYADGGELYDFVERRKKLSSTEARAVFRQIVAAVHYCHKNGVVHRDLKLENILLNSRFEVKLTDFGLCNYYTLTGRLATFCGSPLYASPEIISGQPYMGPEIDCWSLGVLLYAICYGSMPFGHAEFAKLRSQILSGQFFPPPDAGEFSDAHDLICQCLVVSASQRATIDQISMHWWTNVGYVHYPHCDIYGGGADPSQQPTCSCFFDVLNQQISSPPDQFRGKLATKQNCDHEFRGVHAHRSRHHHKKERQKVPSSQEQQAFPTPNSPPSLKNEDMLVKSVSADSLNDSVNGGDDQRGRPWTFTQPNKPGAGIVVPLNENDCQRQECESPVEQRHRSSSAPGLLHSKPTRQISSTSFELSRVLPHRSASLGRRPLVWRNKVLFEEEQQNLAAEESKNLERLQNGNHKLLSSLLDPSVEQLEEVGVLGDSILHRQLSNYDNLATGMTSTSPRCNNFVIDVPPPEMDRIFDVSDQTAPQRVPAAAYSRNYDSSPLSTSSSGSSSSSRSVSRSCSGSSGSLSCSCSCSSIYDGFVGTAALQQQQQQHRQEAETTVVVPPLQFLSSSGNNENTSSNSSSNSNRTSSSGELFVDHSARSAPAALAVERERIVAASSKPSTLIDSISSRSEEFPNQLRVLDDDELVALSHENLDNESTSGD